MSPNVIHTALMHRQCSVLHDPKHNTHDAIPSVPSAEAKAIDATLGWETPTRPFEINKQDTKPQISQI